MTVNNSYWVVKTYATPAGQTAFILGTPETSMLNALCTASGKDSRAELEINELTKDHWRATSDDGRFTYNVYRTFDQPPDPPDHRIVVRDLRPESLKHAPRREMPKKINFGV